MDIERLSRTCEGGRAECEAGESESPAMELSRLNRPITDFFSLGFVIPPVLMFSKQRQVVSEKCDRMGSYRTCRRKKERKINKK